MHAFIEVVAGLAVTPNHVVCDMRAQEVARLVEEGLVVVGQLNREKSTYAPSPEPLSRAATSSAMYFALAPGSPPASVHPRARTR